MKKITHSQYIKSPYWIKFSKKILNDPNVECAMCHRKKWAIYQKATKKHKAGDKKRLIVLNLHHINYNDLGTGNDHVIPLCRRCHQLAHDLEKAGRAESFWKEVYNKLIEISNWEYVQAEYYEVPDDFVLSQSKDKKEEITEEE
jgi:hypothetical protein